MSNKLLVVIVSDDAKAEVGVRMASRMIERGTLNDVRLLFFGPSERLLAEPPAPLRDLLEAVRRQSAPMACRFIAQEMDIVQPLEQAGTELVAAGQEIERRMLEGYQVMTF